MQSSDDKVIASVRAAPAHPTSDGAHADCGAHANDGDPSRQPALRQFELMAQFAAELERVGGKFKGSYSADGLSEAIVTVVGETGAHKILLADGIASNVEALAQKLARRGCEVVHIPAIDDGNRATLRDQLAACDLGVIEADYAIAATGTFCVIAGGRRPSALTILPPANLIYVAAARILPDLAAVIAAVGPERFTSHRVALITGPSRTADIEKMIVIGVHGPKQLYAAAIQ